MSVSKVYELPLSRDYVGNWGVVEAVRELIQNGIDSPAPFEWSFGASADGYSQSNSLKITSRAVRLDAATLVLGRTSKANDDGAIGQFGEGYKLALLVLTREGRRVKVFNGEKVWTPEFRRSLQFGIETLHIIETDAEFFDDEVTFLVDGLTNDDVEAIRSTCLFMQDSTHHDDAISTRMGRILPHRPGKLYVGGLLVCETGLHFGYDLVPGEIQLERDRKTVAEWDLKWKTRDIWYDTKQWGRISELMEAGCPDLDAAEYNAPEMVKEACYQRFIEKNPGKLMAENADDLKKKVESGLTVYVGGGYSRSFASSVRASRGHQESPAHAQVKAQLPPAQVLRDWYESQKKYMPRMPAFTFKRLIAQAEKWGVK